MAVKTVVGKSRMIRVAGGMALLIILAIFLQSLILSFLNKISGNRTTDLLANHFYNLLYENDKNNEKLLDSVKEEYIVRAQTVAFILDSNPEYMDDVSELTRMAKHLDVDEIHIFNDDGVIISGTRPDYYGMSFNSGEQMAFFKPMLFNKKLSMCQGITENTAENKPMIYAITWCLHGIHMVQIGIDAASFMEKLNKNNFSKMFATMPLYEGVTVMLLERASGKIIAATDNECIGSTLEEIGIPQKYLASDKNHKEILKFKGFRNFFDFTSYNDYEIVVAYSTAPHIANFVVSLALVFFYLFFAGLAVIFLVRREEKLIFKSNTDQLTGLYNRRAYEEDLVENKDTLLTKDFIYALMDVNSLKVVNDSLGHEAGDEIIIGAGKCMQRCFGSYGKVYRLGGDEFVAMIYATKEQFEKIKTYFEHEILAWKGKLVENMAVSCGYASIAQDKLTSMNEIVSLADKRMYENKADFYKKKGVDRRGQQIAHTALCSLYTKILKINITDDSYEIVNMDEEELNNTKGISEKISKWLSDFGLSGQVHPDDLDEYLSKTNLSFLRSYFHENKSSISVFYRRKYGDKYNQVVMEMIPAYDYSSENQSLYLYVKKIDK
ncbi:MAG: GGDEF domain-containing protein [Treponema sp.]|nr:GGDEF domain-containing protein [Treponema sp.]